MSISELLNRIKNRFGKTKEEPEEERFISTFELIDSLSNPMYSNNGAMFCNIVTEMPAKSILSINFDYDISVIENPSPLLFRSLSRMRDKIVMMKSKVDSFTNSDEKRFDAYFDIYTFDNMDRVLKIRFNPNFHFRYIGRDNDINLLNLGIILCNQAITLLDLKSRSKYPLLLFYFDRAMKLEKRENISYIYTLSPDFRLSTPIDSEYKNEIDPLPVYNIKDIIPEWNSEFPDDYFDAINDLEGQNRLNKMITSAVTSEEIDKVLDEVRSQYNY